MASTPHIIAMDLYHRGHHLSYLEMLFAYWIENKQRGHLTFLLSQTFFDSHPDFIDRVKAARNKGVECVALNESRTLSGGSVGMLGLIRADRAHRQALLQALSLSPDHIICMFFDHAQRAIARLGPMLQKSGVSVSGIFFRATLHEKPSSVKQWIAAWRKRLILHSALKSPVLKQLCCLDPEAVASINALADKQIAHWLPDGTAISPSDMSSTAFRSEMRIGKTDKLLLLFGTLSRRKGLFKVLEALSLLPAETRNELVLLLAGRSDPAQEHDIFRAVSRARCSVRIMMITDYITDARMSTIFQASNFVLVAYQWHIGSSGILIRAAAAGKPVIGSNHGLVGRNIESHRLGRALDCSDAHKLASSIEHALKDPFLGFDQESASAFVSANSESRFARTILEGAERE